MIAHPGEMIRGQMRLRALAPFALAGVLISLGSSIAVVSTARQSPLTIASSEAPSAQPSAPRALPELSRAARLAFWRDGKLWVSDLSGSLRYAVASTEDMRRISLTRWAPDGGSVAFVVSGLSLAVVTLAGTRTDVDLPFELRTQRYRIADIRWSPNGRRVAATLLQPGDGRSDAFLVDVSAESPQWTRLTTLNDLFAGDWISDDELLASTATGVVGVVTASGQDRIRLLSGSVAVSPVIGPEGRIHFLVGRVPTARDPSLPHVTASSASVWSAATDGSDVRRESAWQLNDIRLDARLPDGRYLVHRGSSSAQATVTDDVEILPPTAGVIERMRVAPDGRFAYGFTAERIVRLDLAKLPAAAPSATLAAAVSVFLETGGEADVWFPSQLSLARGGERVTGLPPLRYAFGIGGHLWQIDGGAPHLLRVGPLLRRSFVPAPRWSPTGDRLIAIEQAGPSVPSSTTLVAVSVDRGGEATRLEQTVGASRSFSWAPGGAEVAVVVDKRGISGITSDAQLEARFLDPSGRITRAPVPASEVAWTAKGLLVLRTAGGAPAVSAVEGGGGLRDLLTREILTADPQARPSESSLGLTVSGLDAMLDGTYLSVRLLLQEPSGSRAYLVVAGSDGSVVRYVRADALSDAAWSPSRPQLGYTLDVRTAAERAVVLEPRTGAELATHEGRFGGWSPDGEWYYVARTTGLFAYPVAGAISFEMAPPLRVGPVGVPVSVARPG